MYGKALSAVPVFEVLKKEDHDFLLEVWALMRSSPLFRESPRVLRARLRLCVCRLCVCMCAR